METIPRILTFALCILATPLAAVAQQQKAHRIGWLMSTPSSSAPSLQATEIFRQALRDLGHVEGRDFVMEYRYAQRGPGQLPDLAAELVRLNVDVIVTGSSDATRAAQQATTTIPIVMAVSAAPVEQGFVASLARPGGNITGLSMLAPEVAGKRLELLKRLVPKAARVAVLRPPMSPNIELQWRETQMRARLLGLELQVLEVQGSTPDYERLFEAAIGGRADALIALADPLFARHRPQILALATRHRLPAMFFERTMVAEGGLMSYGPSIAELFRQAASYVDKLLKGAMPGDLPVGQPRKFELILNLKAAQALGITFPSTLMIQADEVFN